MFQASSFKFCCYFCILNFEINLLSDKVGGLMLSADNPLDFHAKILTLSVIAVKKFENRLKRKLILWSIITKVPSAVKITEIRLLKVFYFLYFCLPYQGQYLLDFYLQGFLLLLSIMIGFVRDRGISKTDLVLLIWGLLD